METVTTGPLVTSRPVPGAHPGPPVVVTVSDDHPPVPVV